MCERERESKMEREQRKIDKETEIHKENGA